jgi:hypothetical protein
MLNHQSLIYRRQLFADHQFDPFLKITADLKHFLEAELSDSISYVDLVLIEYLNGGAAAIQSGIKQNWRERATSWRWQTSKSQRLILMLGVIIRYSLYLTRIKK